MIILNIIESVIFIYLTICVFYLLICSIAGLLPIRASNNCKSNNETKRIAVLIPAYKEDGVIIEVAQEALKQDYPQNKFEIFVIADSMKKTTIEKLHSLKVNVIEVSLVISSKANAINTALGQIREPYDIAVILDADNLMEKNFLNKINISFACGFNAIQGHRTAKNTNTHFALLDAISEEINNHIFRQGYRRLGLSSSLIGSGMAIDFQLYKRLMSKIESIGEDKELEYALLREHEKIEYLHNAYILDEKIQKSQHFFKQRKRWIASQIMLVKNHFIEATKHLLKYGNFDLFNKIIQNCMPPRIILLGLLVLSQILVLLNFYGLNKINSTNILIVSWYMWTTLLIIMILSLIIAIPKKFMTRQTLFALVFLPRAFFLMFTAILKFKSASKKFVHTEHSIKKY